MNGKGPGRDYLPIRGRRVRLLLEEFQTNGPGRVEQISRRIESGDQNAVARTARELKPARMRFRPRRFATWLGLWNSPPA